MVPVRREIRLKAAGYRSTVDATILVRVSGRDRPGITAGLMRVLGDGKAELYDVEQVVVRGRLNLGLLIRVEGSQATIKDLLFYGWKHGLAVDFEIVEETPAPRGSESVVTVIAPAIGPAPFGAVAEAIAEGEGNIERIVRLSRYPVVSYELAVSGGDLDVIRRELVEVAARHRIDVAIQAEGLYRRAKRLVVLDVDSTLVQDEIVDLMAEEAGVSAEVREVTMAAMRGEVDFEEALRSRVRKLAGLDASLLDPIAGSVRLTPGARTFVRTLRRLGMKVAIISGGFTFFTERLKAELELDHAFANTLEVVDGRLSGELTGAVIDRLQKAELLRRIASAEHIPLAQTVAVGDGANDLDMLAAAGLGIAFNAKPAVQEAADTTLTVPYLDAILFLLGIRREEIEAVDVAEGNPARPVPVEGLPPV